MREHSDQEAHSSGKEDRKTFLHLTKLALCVHRRAAPCRGLTRHSGRRRVEPHTAAQGGWHSPGLLPLPPPSRVSSWFAQALGTFLLHNLHYSFLHICQHLQCFPHTDMDADPRRAKHVMRFGCSGHLASVLKPPEGSLWRCIWTFWGEKEL